jgi:hypothetical protein
MQPQSDEEVTRVVRGLRALDVRLDVVWNPSAVCIKKSFYDVMGHSLPAIYDGRWQVIRHDTESLHAGKPLVVVTVTQPVRSGPRQILMMERDGAYAPLGDWLVEYMQTCDAAGRAYVAMMLEKQRLDDGVEAEQDALIHDTAAHQEAAEKVYHDTAGPYWMGRGANFDQ